MRRGLALLLLILLPLAVAQEITKTQTLSIEAQKNALETAAARHISTMDAAINVAREKSLNSSALAPIKENFAIEQVKIKDALDEASFNSIEDTLNSIAKEFRDKAKEIGLQAYPEALDIKRKQFEDINRGPLDKLKEKSLDSRKIALLNVYDNHIETIEHLINVSLERNVTMTQVISDLEAFKLMKQDLVVALNSNNRNDTEEAKNKIKAAWKNIIQHFADAQQMNKLDRSIAKGREISAKVSSNMAKLSDAGINIGAIETRLSQFNSALDAASNSATLDEKKDNLRKAETALNEMKNTYDQIRMGK